MCGGAAVSPAPPIAELTLDSARALLHRRHEGRDETTHNQRTFSTDRSCFFSLFFHTPLFVFPPRLKRAEVRRTLSILASKPSGKSRLGKKWSGNRSPRKNQQQASTSRTGVVEPSYIRLLSFGDAPNATEFGVDCELNDTEPPKQRLFGPLLRSLSVWRYALLADAGGKGKESDGRKDGRSE